MDWSSWIVSSVGVEALRVEDRRGWKESEEILADGVSDMGLSEPRIIGLF